MSSTKRMYSSKVSRESTLSTPSSSMSELTSSPSASVAPRRSLLSRKRSLLDDSTTQNMPLTKKRVAVTSSLFKSSLSRSTPRSGPVQRKAKSNTKVQGTQKQLTQLHFALDTTVLRTCPLCSLTYTRGAPDDESLHRSHCARVQRGMEWGKEEEREHKSGKTNVEEVESNIKLKNGGKGRIICFRADVGGKIGAKLATLLDSINITLSAPGLTAQTLRASKAYLFLLSTESASSSTHRENREKIIGCVIAQRISTAMAIARRSITDTLETHDAGQAGTGSADSQDSPTCSDSSSLSLIPTPLPTPLGIPRLFVSLSHRRLGIATRLLTAAAQNFIHGCPLDPKKGEVAFSQPTGLGKMVLESWAGDKGRVFQET